MNRTDGSDGGPAFPVMTDAGCATSGMSLRDYFAAHAPPVPEQWLKDSLNDGQLLVEAEADWRFEHADAMLKAREG